jgi:type IV pilus assembly protein PilX
MSARTKRRPISEQNGMVLVTALLLLIVVTLLAVGMFRSFGLDEKIAGNVREKQRALSAAETAEQYAEYWLANGNSSIGVACSSTVTASIGQICSTAPSSVTNVVNGLWQNSSGASVGVTYTPTVQTAMNVTTAGGLGTYYYQPAFYITYLGITANGLGKLYQIDAVGYGGSADTVAVVESTYLVQTGTSCLSCSQ